MTFRDRGKKRYQQVKSIIFHPLAQTPGKYNGQLHDFYMHGEHSQKTCFLGFKTKRSGILKKGKIGWHDGLPDYMGRCEQTDGSSGQGLGYSRAICLAAGRMSLRGHHSIFITDPYRQDPQGVTGNRSSCRSPSGSAGNKYLS